MTVDASVTKRLREYYGKTIKHMGDLKENACRCTDDGFSPSVKNALMKLHPDILNRFYGCGSPLPPLLEGCSILDLGCGTGRDAYVASCLAGNSGRVVGLDMTEEQLAVARLYIKEHTERFGYSAPNVEFRQGYIEDLGGVGIEDDSMDIVISNCVINLSGDKKKLFSEIFRVLKPGGELIFSDVFAGRRVPSELYDDPVLHGECLAGAMYEEDFRRILLELNIRDYRLLNRRPVELQSEPVKRKIGMVDFYSVSVRVFKLASLEDICEDYGQAAIYKGTIDDYPHYFDLDDHHRFITGKPMLVCGNTASMLEQTRYSAHFNIIGDRSVHYGPFTCGPAAQKADNESGAGGACC
ncbi:MAG: methyltransferase domain-containing protein [Desulfobulbaceae bacterium]|nr:methyltransferase domain-containing protein [Desulfobulbaceae bacterium]